MRVYHNAIVLALIGVEGVNGVLFPHWAQASGKDKVIIDDDEGVIMVGDNSYEAREVIAILVADKGRYTLVPPAAWGRVSKRWYLDRQQQKIQESTDGNKGSHRIGNL